MTNLPFISIIFPNYNGKSDALECLASLFQLNYPKEKLEIIVVDNGSNDSSQTAINEFILGHRDIAIKLIENKKNLGAPAAYNQGICAANKNYDYIWKLDNDVILEKNSLIELIKLAENDKKIGMISGKIYFGDSYRQVTVAKQAVPIIWAIGGKINYFLGNFRNVAKNQKDYSYEMSRFVNDRTKIQTRKFQEKFNNKYNKIRKDFDFLPGCALLIRHKVIDKIGLLDKKYFVYYDEADWCVRAKEAGFELVFAPAAKIWHKASRTTQEGSYFKNYYLTRNKILFLRKFKKSIFFPILFTLGFEIWHRWLFRSKLSDLPNILRGVIKGIKNGISNI